MAQPVKATPNLFGATPVFVQVTPKPVFPNRTQQALDAEKWLQDKTACEAQGGSFEADSCVMPPPTPEPTQETVTGAPIAPQAVYNSGLTGSYGYSMAGGNCVNEPGINNPGYGNPIDWLPTSYAPWIGATVLFSWNHTAVVSGIWGNGDVEVRQQNCPSCPTRYPRSMIRGFR